MNSRIYNEKLTVIIVSFHSSHIIENSMLNGEVIRLDGAVRLQPR